MHLKFWFTLVILAILAKFLAITYTNFDFFGDEAQYWVWSQNVDLGYYSKPPLLAWLISVVVFFFGSSFWVLKVIPIGAYILTSYIIFLISNKLYKNTKLSYFVTISFYLCPAVSVSSFLISTDIILLLFWCLSLLFLLKIRENSDLSIFLYLGFFLGLAFLSKYAAIYFLISLFFLIIIDKKIRQVFLSNSLGIVLFLFGILIVLSPNIFWNINNGWITINHTSDNAALNRINLNLSQGLNFLLVQTLMMGIFLSAYFFYSIRKITMIFETKFLLCFSAPIFFIVLLESILVRANANWAAVAIPPLLILLVNHAYNNFKKAILINNLINAIFCFVLFFLISTSSNFKIFDRISGISLFAKELKINMGRNDFLIVEDRLLYSNLKYEYRKSKIKMLTPHRSGEPYKNYFQMHSPLPKSFDKNFIYIGFPENINYLDKKFKIREIYSSKERFKNKNISVYEIIF